MIRVPAGLWSGTLASGAPSPSGGLGSPQCQPGQLEERVPLSLTITNQERSVGDKEQGRELAVKRPDVMLLTEQIRSF